MKGKNIAFRKGMSFSSDSIYDCMILAPKSFSRKIPARHFGIPAARGVALFALLVFIVQFFASNCDLHAADPGALPFGKAIKEISYASDLPIDRSHYDSFIGIKPGDILTRTGVKSAIQSLYDTGRFSGIVVDAFPDGDAARLRFTLEHNYYFNKFSAEKINLKGRFLWELAFSCWCRNCCSRWPSATSL